MKKIYELMPKNNKIAFWVCLTISILLIIGGFICPPLAVIDGSILTAVGELFGFAALSAIFEGMERGRNTTITKGDMTIKVGENGTGESIQED